MSLRGRIVLTNLDTGIAQSGQSEAPIRVPRDLQDADGTIANHTASRRQSEALGKLYLTSGLSHHALEVQRAGMCFMVSELPAPLSQCHSGPTLEATHERTNARIAQACGDVVERNVRRRNQLARDLEANVIEDNLELGPLDIPKLLLQAPCINWCTVAASHGTCERGAVMRLSSWQRAGVIISTIWIVGAPVVAWDVYTDNGQQRVETALLKCEIERLTLPPSALHPDLCTQKVQDAYARAYKWLWLKIVAIAILPVALAWTGALLSGGPVARVTNT